VYVVLLCHIVHTGQGCFISTLNENVCCRNRVVLQTMSVEVDRTAYRLEPGPHPYDELLPVAEAGDRVTCLTQVR